MCQISQMIELRLICKTQFSGRETMLVERI